jgi:DNA mismatch repair protein MutS
LTELAAKKMKVKNFNIAVKEWNDEIIFIRKLVEGSTNRSYGIQVARLAGIPPAVLHRAKKILHSIEHGEHISARVPRMEYESAAALHGPKQLDLFEKAENNILMRLANVDLSKMTPLDALNFLNELQEKAKLKP